MGAVWDGGSWDGGSVGWGQLGWGSWEQGSVGWGQLGVGQCGMGPAGRGAVWDRTQERESHLCLSAGWWRSSLSMLSRRGLGHWRVSLTSSSSASCRWRGAFQRWGTWHIRTVFLLSLPTLRSFPPHSLLLSLPPSLPPSPLPLLPPSLPSPLLQSDTHYSILLLLLLLSDNPTATQWSHTHQDTPTSHGNQNWFVIHCDVTRILYFLHVCYYLLM